LILAFPVIASAAAALVRLADLASRPLAAGATEARLRLVRGTACGAFLLACGVLWAGPTLAPVNESYAGYRLAGEWLERNTAPGAKVFDLKGWASFYGRRDGYSFGDLDRSPVEAGVGWVVAHDAFLIGPWPYCQTVRDLVGDRAPVRSFPEVRCKGMSQVHVFELSPAVARSERGGPAARR
jgi:hypothetical protein